MIETIESQWFNFSSKSKADQETTAQIKIDKKIPATVICLALAAVSPIDIATRDLSRFPQIEHSLQEWKDGTKRTFPFSDEIIKSSYVILFLCLVFSLPITI